MNNRLRAAAAAFAIAPVIALGSGVATADPVPGPSAGQLHEVAGGGFCGPMPMPWLVGSFILWVFCV